MNRPLSTIPFSLLNSREFTFFLLALIIMGPLLGPGRILTLDSPLALNFDFAEYFSWSTKGAESVFAATYNSAPIAAVLRGLDLVLPFQVVEKAWLVLLLWLCAVGASRLPYIQGVGSYYAGFFYLVNPFTYIRFVSGQWGILGAYALIPFAATSFINLLEDPSRKRIVVFALILTVISHLQIHGLALALLVLGPLYLTQCATVPGRFKQSLPWVAWSGGLFLLLNSFWIARFIVAGGGVTKNMPVAELGYFAAFPPLDVLSLRGSWLSGAYVDIYDLVPVWWLLFLPLLVLAVYGAMSMWDNSRLRWLALGLAFAGLAGLVMAAGPGTPGIGGLFTSLWEEFPIYRGFRETHKFTALLALVYAYLGAFGLQILWEKIRQRATWPHWAPYATAGVFFVLTAAYALPIFGVWGQVKPTDYPEDWHTVRSILDDDPDDFSVLVLPWHMYMDFDWLPNRWKNLANPAPSFFSQPVISGDNIEIAANYSDSSDPRSKYVEELLRGRDELDDFGSRIAPLGAKYVVLFKTADYEEYGFLSEQGDLELVFGGGTIALYQVPPLLAR